MKQPSDRAVRIAVPLAYLALAIALTWPTVETFTTRIGGDGDVRASEWRAGERGGGREQNLAKKKGTAGWLDAAESGARARARTCARARVSGPPAQPLGATLSFTSLSSLISPPSLLLSQHLLALAAGQRLSDALDVAVGEVDAAPPDVALLLDAVLDAYEGHAVDVLQEQSRRLRERLRTSWEQHESGKR